MKNGKTLILGFGNEILTDDGIAVKIVKSLKDLDKDPKISYETAWLGGLEILDYFNNTYNKAVFIDAVKTGEDKPGTVKKFDLQDFTETLHLSNFHDASFVNTIKLGRKLGYSIPDHIKIISIEIVEDEEFSVSFSKEIEEKYQDIVVSVSEMIREP